MPPLDAIPHPVFLGFLLKELWRPTEEWVGYGGMRIDVICSAGDCIASRPSDWVERWDWNRASCWSIEEAALNTVPKSRRAKYGLYAYRAIPIEFGKDGQSRRIANEELFYRDMPPLPPEPDLSAYERLGYDPVEYIGLANFGCSPLSCNGEFHFQRVNQFCLIDELETAIETARVFGIEEPEPGPYIIIEVSCKRGSFSEFHERSVHATENE
jgi:hypothetical protein